MTDRAAGRAGAKLPQDSPGPDNYEELVNSLGAIVWERDAATLRFTFVSRQAERLLGYPSGQWLSDPHFWEGHIHAEDRACLHALRAARATARKHHEIEYRMVAADGRWVWLRDIITVVSDHDRPVKLRGLMVDISAQKQDAARLTQNAEQDPAIPGAVGLTEHVEAEERLRLTEAQYRAIFEAVTDGLVISDLDGHVLEVNPAFARALGYTREELIGLDPRSWVHPDSHANIAEFLDKIRAGEGFYTQGQQVRKDGTVFPAEVYGTPFLYNGQRHALAIIHDITEGVQAQALLEQRVEERTRALATLAQVASQIAFGGSLQATLEILCRHATSVTRAVAAAIVLRDPETQKDYIAGSYGLPDGYATTLNKIVAAAGNPPMMRDAVAGQRATLARNMRRTFLDSAVYAPLHPFVEQVSWDTVVGVPMKYRDAHLGALLSYHLPTADIGEAEIGLHAVIADQAAVAVANARLLAESQDKARLEERQRLARDLHDSVTQALFSISLLARSVELVAQREGTHSADTLEKLADLRGLTQGALAEMRALIFELRPGALEEEGLVEALRKHAAAVQGREMLKVEIVVTSGGALPRLDPRTEEALYRVAQEALHNVVKHARATAAEIRLAAVGARVELRVSDNGTGFDPANVGAGHMGLGTMRQRVEALGGQYRIESRPGGTTVSVWVPLSGAVQQV